MQSPINVSVYRAIRITGRTGREVWDEFYEAEPIYLSRGIRLLNPLEGEDIPYNDEPIPNRPGEEGKQIWRGKDKRMIRDEADACVYPGLSNGICREYMLSRGVYWIPSIFVGSYGFIAEEEDDSVCATEEQAADLIVELWGTTEKRCKWRLAMLNRSLLSWIAVQIRKFK
jgi:hypothetical protein